GLGKGRVAQVEERVERAYRRRGHSPFYRQSDVRDARWMLAGYERIRERRHRTFSQRERISPRPRRLRGNPPVLHAEGGAARLQPIRRRRSVRICRRQLWLRISRERNPQEPVRRE